ncbi:uncharacterized protein EAE98_000864 [Botrytis deweyae]|uniref:Uncharacterized protein n=1 Tax=Botrytis deweyae TaxID=2478750 RepID=A0ABQ7IZV4_9HELO|nr:uncharacterized protein EAE98_000864 [Botrytis deweyae]KAF7938526.1 hypothetical protein EAE98_000864 [Botrytis deweyae]
MSSFQLRRTVPVYQNPLISATVPSLIFTAMRPTAVSARSYQNGGPWHTPVNPIWRQNRFYAINRREPKQIKNIIDVLTVYASGRQIQKTIKTLENDAKVHLDVTARVDMKLIPAYATLLDLTMKMVADANPPELWNQSQNGEAFRQQFPESLRSTVKWIQNNSKTLKPPSHSVVDLAQSAVRPFEDARDLCLTTQDRLGRIHEQIMDMQHNIGIFNIELERADKVHPRDRKMLAQARDNTISRQFVTSNDAYTAALNDAKIAQNMIKMLNEWVQPYFDSGELKGLKDEVSLLLDRTITQKDVLERILTDHVRGTAIVANTWFRPVFHHRFAEKILDILALAPPSEMMLPYMRSILALLSWPGTSVLTPDSDSLARWRRRPQSDLRTRLDKIVKMAEGYQKRFSYQGSESALRRYMN